MNPIRRRHIAPGHGRARRKRSLQCRVRQLTVAAVTVGGRKKLLENDECYAAELLLKRSFAFLKDSQSDAWIGFHTQSVLWSCLLACGDYDNASEYEGSKAFKAK